MLEFVRRGSYVFDYGNNLRGEAREAGVAEAFSYPGFVPAYIRPLFCRGIGPFRWAALSGDPADIAAIDEELQRALPGRRAAPAVARARARAGRVPGAAGADLLARLRRSREGGARDQRARPHRARQGAGRDRARPPRRRLGRVALPRDGGDARRLRRDRRLADPERAAQRRGGCDVGQRPPRRRRRHRQLDPRGHGRRRRRDRGCGRAARARAHDRPGHGVMRHADAGYEEALDAARARRARPAVAPAPTRRGERAAGCSSATSRSSRHRPGRAPLRGRALGDVEVIEDAYVLCAARRSRRSGGCATSALGGDVEELDGRGCCAIPGLVDCHTHACFAGDRVEEFSLRARGATYEELHAAGGGILSTVRATRARARTARRGRRASPRLDAPATGRRRSRQVGLRARPRHRARVARAIAAAEASRPGSARMPCRRSSTTPTRTSTSLLAEVLPDAAQLAEAADVFLERGAFDAAQARRYLEACRDAGLALRLHGDQFTEAGAIPLAIELGARSSTTSRRPARGRRRARRERRRRRAAARERALPRPADAAGPRARRCRRGGRARDRLQPGSAFCESLPLVCSLACTQLQLRPARRSPPAPSTQRTCSAAPTGSVASRPATAQTSCSSTRPTGATSPTTSAATSSRGSSSAASRVAARHNRAGAHEEAATPRGEGEPPRVRDVYVDDEGNEVERRVPRKPPEEAGNGREAARAASKPRSGARAAGAHADPPSWRRVLRRAAIFAPIFIVVVLVLNRHGSIDARSARRSRSDRSSSPSATSSTGWPTGRTSAAERVQAQPPKPKSREKLRSQAVALAAVVA